jgi:hypothetical protein
MTDCRLQLGYGKSERKHGALLFHPCNKGRCKDAASGEQVDDFVKRGTFQSQAVFSNIENTEKGAQSVGY